MGCPGAPPRATPATLSPIGTQRPARAVRRRVSAVCAAPRSRHARQPGGLYGQGRGAVGAARAVRRVAGAARLPSGRCPAAPAPALRPSPSPAGPTHPRPVLTVKHALGRAQGAVAGDIDGDGQLEVVVGTASGYVYALAGSTGQWMAPRAHPWAAHDPLLESPAALTCCRPAPPLPQAPTSRTGPSARGAACRCVIYFDRTEIRL